MNKTQFCPPLSLNFSKFLIVFILIKCITFESLSQIHLGNVCTGQSKSFTHNLPWNHCYVKVTIYGEGPGGTNRIIENWPPCGSIYTWSHTFNGIPGNANMLVQTATNTLTGSLTSGTSTSYVINETLPAPNFPSNGLLEFCGGNQTIQATSNPALQNNQQDCFFHCNYIWEASGFNINGSSNFYESGGNSVSINGGGNGDLGNLKLTAKYSACLPNVNSQHNPYSYTKLWGGTPNINNFYANGMPYSGSGSIIYSNGGAQLSVQNPGGVRNMQWTVIQGNCNLYPSGNSCTASPSNFSVGKVQGSNNCGQGNSFNFYLMPQGYSGYRIISNPTKGNNINLLFESEDIINLFLEEIVIFDKNGKTKIRKLKNDLKNNKNKDLIELETKNIENGNYFLHVKIGDNIFKNEIIINS